VCMLLSTSFYMVKFLINAFLDFPLPLAAYTTLEFGHGVF